MTRNANTFHEKPAGVIEEDRSGWKPTRQQQAPQVAHQHQAAQGHGQQIGRSAYRSDNVEIVRDQGNRAEPSGQ